MAVSNQRSSWWEKVRRSLLQQARRNYSLLRRRSPCTSGTPSALATRRSSTHRRSRPTSLRWLRGADNWPSLRACFVGSPPTMRRLTILAACIVSLAADARGVHAGCNLIPSAQTTFRAALGSTERPFAGPGDLLEVRVGPACEAASVGFSERVTDEVVTFVFTPPGGTSKNVVVVVATGLQRPHHVLPRRGLRALRGCGRSGHASGPRDRTS